MDLYDVSNITYDVLANLNYLELKTLCSSNTKYANICNNETVLNNILTLKLANHGYNLKLDVNVSKSLNLIYTWINRQFNTHYNDNIPYWVDKNKFKKYMVNRILQALIEEFVIAYNDFFDINGDMVNNLTLGISKFTLAIPFYSKNITIPKDGDEEDENPMLANLLNGMIMKSVGVNYIAQAILASKVGKQSNKFLPTDTIDQNKLIELLAIFLFII